MSVDGAGLVIMLVIFSAFCVLHLSIQALGDYIVIHRESPGNQMSTSWYVPPRECNLTLNFRSQHEGNSKRLMGSYEQSTLTIKWLIDRLTFERHTVELYGWTLSNISLEDAGWYTCDVDMPQESQANPNCSIDMNVTRNVLYVYSKPDIPIITQSEWTSLGQEVTLHCSTRLTSRPPEYRSGYKVTWFVDGRDVAEYDIKTRYRVGGHIMTIISTTNTDLLTNFSCAAYEDGAKLCSERSDQFNMILTDGSSATSILVTLTILTLIGAAVITFVYRRYRYLIRKLYIRITKSRTSSALTLTLGEGRRRFGGLLGLDHTPAHSPIQTTSGLYELSREPGLDVTYYNNSLKRDLLRSGSEGQSSRRISIASYEDTDQIFATVNSQAVVDHKVGPEGDSYALVSGKFHDDTANSQVVVDHKVGPKGDSYALVSGKFHEEEKRSNVTNMNNGTRSRVKDRPKNGKPRKTKGQQNGHVHMCTNGATTKGQGQDKPPGSGQKVKCRTDDNAPRMQGSNSLQYLSTDNLCVENNAYNVSI